MNWLTYALLSALFASLVGIFGKDWHARPRFTLATAARSVVMAASPRAASCQLWERFQAKLGCGFVLQDLAGQHPGFATFARYSLVLFHVLRQSTA